MTGIVKSFNDARGYGFVMPLIGKPDEVELVYFHITQFRNKDGRRSLAPPVGAELKFDLCRSERGNGQQACNCELITRPLKPKPVVATRNP